MASSHDVPGHSGQAELDKLNAQLGNFNSLLVPKGENSIVVEDLSQMNAEAAAVQKKEAGVEKGKTQAEKGRARAEKMGQGMSKFFADVRGQVQTMMASFRSMFNRTKTVAAEVATKAAHGAAEAAYTGLGAAETGVEKVGAAAAETKRWTNEDMLDMDKSVVVQGAKVGAEKAVATAVAGYELGAAGAKAAGRGIRKGAQYAAMGAAIPFLAAAEVGLYAAKKGTEAAKALTNETIKAMDSVQAEAERIQAQVGAKIAEGQAVYNAAAQTARALKGGVNEIFQQNLQSTQDQQWVAYFDALLALPEADRHAKFNAMSPQEQYRVNTAYHMRYRDMVKQQAGQMASPRASRETQVGGSM